jgi:phenol hydroxylase P0 protein
MHPQRPAAAAPTFDPALRFVRITQVRPDGFIEFDFAAGEPELSVELILPAAAFHEFCRAHHATPLGPIDLVAPAR